MRKTRVLVVAALAATVTGCPAKDQTLTVDCAAKNGGFGGPRQIRLGLDEDAVCWAEVIARRELSGVEIAFVEPSQFGRAEPAGAIEVSAVIGDGTRPDEAVGNQASYYALTQFRATRSGLLFVRLRETASVTAFTEAFPGSTMVELLLGDFVPVDGGSGFDLHSTPTDLLPPSPDEAMAEIDATMPTPADMAGADQASAGDLTPPTCDPIAQANVCTSGQGIAAAIAAWAKRCNPELNDGDATLLADRACARASLTDGSLTYDQNAAGQCACDLLAASCELIDPFRQLTSCRDTVKGTATTGQSCSLDEDCADGYCRGLENACAVGKCYAYVADSQECTDGTGNLRCETGLGCFTFTDLGSPTCKPQAAVSQTCQTGSDCQGGNAFLLPHTLCASEGGGVNACHAAGRSGNSCGVAADCVPSLYSCPSGLCMPLPGIGEACSVLPDKTDPTHAQWLAVLTAAKSACRLGTLTYCTPSGTTSGQGICKRRPQVGQPCGLGKDLSPLCEDGYCSISPATFGTGSTGTCLAKHGATESCDSAYNTLGGQCASGLSCSGGTCQRLGTTCY